VSNLLPAADTRTQAPFARIAVVGFGLIGGSVALAVRERWPSTHIIAVDRRDVIETALRMHAADVGADDLVMAADAELVVLAAPVRTNIRLLTALGEHIPGNALVTDVGSTKREMVAAARGLPARLRFVGGHPLAGSATGGVAAARPDLFVGRPWILTPADESGEADVAALTLFISALGAAPRRLTPDAHDDLVAYLSHLPQLVVSALMHVVGAHAGEAGLTLAGRGLRDTTRLASSPADVWRDIAATNPDHIGRALDDLIAVLRRMRSDPGGTAMDDTFGSAAEWKRALERVSEGT